MPFTVEEIAARERVSERTVRNWCTGGLIPAYKAGRQWRIERHYRDALREGNAAGL
jgi:excisionase family DNA binding protein